MKKQSRIRGKLHLWGCAAVCLALAGCGKAPVQEGQRTQEAETREASLDVQASEAPSPADVSGTQEDAAVQTLLAELENYGDPEVYAKLFEMRKAPENPVNPEGEWHRTNVHNSLWGSITVSQVTAESFSIEGEFGYFSHSGVMSETAYYIADNLAMIRYESGFGDSQEQYVAFLFDDGGMEVRATAGDASLDFGAGVSMSGTYTQGEPVYTNDGILRELFSENVLADLRSLLPEEYYTDFFVFSTENGLPSESVETLSDGREVKVVECFVPTMGGYGYTLYYAEDGYYSITFENDTEFTTAP